MLGVYNCYVVAASTLPPLCVARGQLAAAYNIQQHFQLFFDIGQQLVKIIIRLSITLASSFTLLTAICFI